MKETKLNDKIANYFGRLKSKPTEQNKKKNGKMGFMAKMQLLGKTFMLPIATLSFCGILLGIGSGLTSEAMIAQQPWLGTTGLYEFLKFLAAIGNVGFVFLPFLFAMSIPLGLASDNKGVAAIAGFLAYGALTLITGTMVQLLPESLTWVGTTLNDAGEKVRVVGEGGYIGKSVTSILGVDTLDYGVLGGILTGLLVWQIHEKFQYVKLPAAIGFWGGTRFVPLFSTIVFAGIAVVMVFAWPGINLGLYYIGFGVNKLEWGSPMLVQLVVVLTRPAGLHHMFNSLVRYTSIGGTWVNAAGTEIDGAFNIYFEQLKQGGISLVNDGVNVTKYLSQGYMPIMMFGLPGVALAIYLAAPKWERKNVASVVVPGIIASAVGGISEPIEFLFLFVAPTLYFFHAILTGLSYTIVGLIGVKVGNTDGNIIDFIVFGVIQGLDTKWYWIPLVGVGFFGAYFGIWYGWIKWRNVMTIGRDVPQDNVQVQVKNLKGLELGHAYLDLLGGKENIKILDNCFSRLRITLNNHVPITTEQVKELGAIGIKLIDDVTIQIVVGPAVENVKNDIKKAMK